MATFANKVLGMLNIADTLTPQFQRIERPNDPLEPLFDDIQTPHLVATYHTLASQYQIPQMAQFHAFDVPAQKSIAAPIDEHNVEKGLIKVKRNTSELLRQLASRGVTAESELYNSVMDFAYDLASQVVTRSKIARAEVMATGKMTISENNLSEVVDYGVPAENTSLVIDLGAGADKTVTEQIQEIVDKAADSGVTLSGIVTSRSALTKLRSNDSVQKAINGAAMVGVLVSNAALAAWFDAEFGISSIITDDQSYSTPWEVGQDGRPVVNTQRYYPKDKITFYGTGNGMLLGSSLWGLPPETDITAYADVQGSSASPYVYITQWAEQDPAVLWTKASALYVPVLYNPYSLYIATFTETPGAGA